MLSHLSMPCRWKHVTLDSLNIRRYWLQSAWGTMKQSGWCSSHQIPQAFCKERHSKIVEKEKKVHIFWKAMILECIQLWNLWTVEVEVVASNWVEGKNLQNGDCASCFWPPFKDPRKACKERATPDKKWHKYKVEIIIAHLGSYDKAKKCLAYSVGKSLSMEDEENLGKGKRRKQTQHF